MAITSFGYSNGVRLDSVQALQDEIEVQVQGHDIPGTVSGMYTSGGGLDNWIYTGTYRDTQFMFNKLQALSAYQGIFAALRPLAPHGTVITISAGMIMLSAHQDPRHGEQNSHVLGARVRPGGGRTNAPRTQAIVGALAAGMPVGTDHMLWASDASQHAKMAFRAQCPGIEDIVEQDPLAKPPYLPAALRLFRFPSIAILLDRHADINDTAWMAV